MVSYSVGGYASTETVLKSWLKHFIENENKLIKDLKTEEAFKNLWIYDILNKDKLSNIENEFKLLYSDWTYDNVSNDLREEILKNMEGKYHVNSIRRNQPPPDLCHHLPP